MKKIIRNAELKKGVEEILIDAQLATSQAFTNYLTLESDDNLHKLRKCQEKQAELRGMTRVPNCDTLFSTYQLEAFWRLFTKGSNLALHPVTALVEEGMLSLAFGACALKVGRYPSIAYDRESLFLIELQPERKQEPYFTTATTS